MHKVAIFHLTTHLNTPVREEQDVLHERQGKGTILRQERLFSPKELGELVGLSATQVRALMNDGRLEFVEISSKTKMLTMSGWERFTESATKVKSPEGGSLGVVSDVT